VATAAPLHDKTDDTLLELHQADAANLPSEARSRFTRDEIIRAIHNWTLRYGEPPRSYDWDPAWARRRGEEWRAERFDPDQWPTLAIVRRQFGNLSKALFAAGVRPRSGPIRARGQLLTDEQILEAVREWTRRFGEPPTRSDWSPARARQLGQLWRVDRYYAGDWPSFSTVLRRFGTLATALRLAGEQARPPGRHTSSNVSLETHLRKAVSGQLQGADRCGPRVLATRVRRVSEARIAGDALALRGALLDLATAAVSWADTLTIDPVALQRAEAA
jgi:hypothetical protein